MGRVSTQQPKAGPVPSGATTPDGSRAAPSGPASSGPALATSPAVPSTPETDALEPNRRRIALIAHDNRKTDLLEWARYNCGSLTKHYLLATGTTGTLLSKELGLQVQRVESGPLGGDLQIGAMITEGTIDVLVFFWDPLEPQPHDPDVKALLRVAVVWNIPIACNRATADYLISSPLMTAPYEPATRHYGASMKPVRPLVGH